MIGYIGTWDFNDSFLSRDTHFKYEVGRTYKIDRLLPRKNKDSNTYGFSFYKNPNSVFNSLRTNYSFGRNFVLLKINIENKKNIINVGNLFYSDQIKILEIVPEEEYQKIASKVIFSNESMMPLIQEQEKDPNYIDINTYIYKNKYNKDKNIIKKECKILKIGEDTGWFTVEKFSYDADGRLIQISYNDEEYVKYNYDKKGNILSIVFPEEIGKMIFLYDRNNKLIKEINTAKLSTLSYEKYEVRDFKYNKKGKINNIVSSIGTEQCFIYKNNNLSQINFYEYNNLIWVIDIF
jgi:YD repeat-containing protein